MTSTEAKLAELYRTAPRRPLTDRDRVVILSDLHMGRGDRLDDFHRNGDLVLQALRHFYLPKGYTLILNGDIEELLRAPRAAILEAWAPMYALFDEFRRLGRLVWLRGNHEILPGTEGDPFHEGHFDGEALVLEAPEGPLFVFHGHQAGRANSGRYNSFIGWSLRALATPLRIGNRAFPVESRRRFRIEHAVYEFSRRQRLVSVIGHTHRPLFESQSRAEAAAIRIDRLCRDYAQAGPRKRQAIRQTVERLKRSLEQPSHQTLADRVYGKVPVPCVFNSGCAVGKRGFTTIEVRRGRIALVFWSSPDRSWRADAYNEYKTPKPYGLSAYRSILRQARLSFVFSRIELWGGLS